VVGDDTAITYACAGRHRLLSARRKRQHHQRRERQRHHSDTI